MVAVVAMVTVVTVVAEVTVVAMVTVVAAVAAVTVAGGVIEHEVTSGGATQLCVITQQPQHLLASVLLS